MAGSLDFGPNSPLSQGSLCLVSHVVSFRSQRVSLLTLDLCIAGNPVCSPSLRLAASCSFSVTLYPGVNLLLA